MGCVWRPGLLLQLKNGVRSTNSLPPPPKLKDGHIVLYKDSVRSTVICVENFTNPSQDLLRVRSHSGRILRCFFCSRFPIATD